MTRSHSTSSPRISGWTALAEDEARPQPLCPIGSLVGAAWYVAEEDHIDPWTAEPAATAAFVGMAVTMGAVCRRRLSLAADDVVADVDTVRRWCANVEADMVMSGSGELDRTVVSLSSWLISSCELPESMSALLLLLPLPLENIE